MSTVTRKTRAACARASRGAFTLVELLVAATITALLAGFIVLVVANVSGFWTRNSGRLSTEAQARYVLDQLTLDLESALYRDDGSVWLAVDVLTEAAGPLKPATALGTALRYDAPDIAGATFGRSGSWLRFFTSKRGTNLTLAEISAPVAVGWRIVRRTPTVNSRDPRYFLHRAEVRPAQTGTAPGTLDAGFDITAPAYGGTTPLPGDSGAAGDPSSVRTPPRDAIVGENVIDFGVRLYARDSTGNLAAIFPQAASTTHRASRPPGVGDPEAQFPEVADVMVRILTEEGARLIAGFEANPPRVTRPPSAATDAQYWWPLALAHSQVFTRRIALRGARSL